MRFTFIKTEKEELEEKIKKLEQENKIYKDEINKLTLKLKFKNEVMKHL